MDDEFVYIPVPIRQDIEVLPADKPKTRPHSARVCLNQKGELEVKTFRISIGFKVSEKIGIAVINPRGVSAGSKTI